MAHPSLPPGPRSALLATIGLIRDPYAMQRSLRARYGKLVTFPSLNGKLVLGLSPEHAKAVFTAPPETFTTFATDTIAEVVEPESLLVSDGARHKRDRKLLTPPFHGARMRAYGDAMQEIARARVERWRVGDVVRMHDEATAMTLDVILRSVFGVATGPELDRGRAILGQVVHHFRPSILFTRRLHTPLFPAWRAFLRTREELRAWLQQRIDQARAEGPGEDLLGLMLAARYDDGSAMSDREIAVQLVTLLIAGHETTSIALTWAVYWLLRHPAALARLRDELDALGPEPEPEAVAKLPFLGAVCDEAMRLHVIVPEVLRGLKKPLVMGHHEIPAGFGVGVGIAAIHEDPAIYPEPHAFRPERFLERKFGPFEHLPFGGGHRRCIGAAFALYEMKLVLATVTSSLELASAGPEERPVRRNVTMAPAHGVPVRVVGRRRPSGAKRSSAGLGDAAA
jgi:cytochrome P450